MPPVFAPNFRLCLENPEYPGELQHPQREIRESLMAYTSVKWGI